MDAALALGEHLPRVDTLTRRAVRHRVVVAVGGSDVESPTAMMWTAEKFAAIQSAGHDVVGVIEMPRDRTAELRELASDVSPDPQGRELDILLASGGQEACALLAMTMWEIGLPAISLVGGKAGIRTDLRHGDAVIVQLELSLIRRSLRLGLLPVVSGRQGETSDGEVTTLSGDALSTALILASALNASCTTTDSLRNAPPSGATLSVVRPAGTRP
jgi:aspartate kinase